MKLLKITILSIFLGVMTFAQAQIVQIVQLNVEKSINKTNETQQLKEQPNAQCGSSHEKTLSEYPMRFCSKGEKGKVNFNGSTYSWSCEDNAGKKVYCSAIFEDKLKKQ